jgi:arylsulfatase A-like enzyme
VILRAAWVALAALAGSLGFAAWGADPETEDARANVVVIMTDDMRLDDLAAMPNVQRLLVDRGVTFEQALSTYPQCCPARATLLTGQYSHNNGVEGNRWPRGGFRRLNDANTLPVWLDRNGYRTAFVGKYLNQYAPNGGSEYVPPGWHLWRAAVYGIYDFFGLTTNDDGEVVGHDGLHQSVVLEQYVDEIVSTYARSDRPFFLWAAHVAPHAECVRENVKEEGAAHCWAPPSPAPVDEGTFAGVGALESPAVNEADVSDKTELLRDREPLPESKLAAMRQGRLESLQSVDRAVAALVDRLEQTGAWDETYVVFTSDNGFALGEHRWMQKQLPYEEVVRVPLVITGPGIPAGESRQQTVSLADVTATALDVAGIQGGRLQDGESLLPLARGETADAQDRLVLLEAGPRRGRGDGWLHQSVRSDRYTLIRWEDGFVELYDRDRDPYQLDSVALQPAYDDVRSYLERALDELVDCRGAECRRVYSGPGPKVTP